MCGRAPRRRRERRPVYMYIHGGGNTEGSGAVPVYDGEGLAKKGIIVVTVNYRLGIFGFFTHPELTAESGRPLLRQLRSSRPDRGAALDSRQHRRFRRRPESRHYRGPIGGRIQHPQPGCFAAGKGAIPRRHRGERIERKRPGTDERAHTGRPGAGRRAIRRGQREPRSIADLRKMSLEGNHRAQCRA